MSPLPFGYQDDTAIRVRGRFRPLADLYHQSFGGGFLPPSWGLGSQVAPTAASTTQFKTGFAGPNTTTVVVTRTGIVAGNVVFDGTYANGMLDYHRNVVITVTHASAVVALSGVITGTDVYGKTITEAWSVTAGTTSKTFTGKRSFFRVDSVTVVAVADASADTVSIGDGQVFGLDLPIASQTPASTGRVSKAILEIVDNAVVTTGTIAALSTDPTEDPRGTYSPATAPNGTHLYDIWYITDFPMYADSQPGFYTVSGSGA